MQNVANVDIAHALLLATLVDIVSARYNDPIEFRNQLMLILEGEIEGLTLPDDTDATAFAQFKSDTVTRMRQLVTTKSMGVPLPH
jgi:hypothetical protein